jgi:fatty acid desaturase
VLSFDALLLAVALELDQHEGAFVHGCAVLLLLMVLLHAYLVLHECVHGVVFADGRTNVALGHLLGFVILCPFLSRRRSHALHHAWTGHIELDPTNARAVRRLSTLSTRSLALLDLWWRAYVPVLALNERVGLWRAPFGPHKSERSAATERRATYVYLAGYAAVLGCLLWFGHLARAVSLYAPAFALLLMAEELINLPHHAGAPLTRSRLALWEQGRVTHSCAEIPVWSRFVLLHFGLHTAHHLWPSYAWYELPAAHRTLGQMTGLATVNNELRWSLRQRRRPFTTVMSQYLPTEILTMAAVPRPAHTADRNMAEDRR